MKLRAIMSLNGTDKDWGTRNSQKILTQADLICPFDKNYKMNDLMTVCSISYINYNTLK